MNTPCAQLLPGHRHCEHGHVNDCPDPTECEPLPEPHDLRIRAGVDSTLRAIRFGTDDEAREAYDQLISMVTEPASQLMFVRFHEYNDHEGESWDWWLQLTGNEEALAFLGGMLNEINAENDDPWLSLHLEDLEPEGSVDKLVEYAENGYFSAHNKVIGVLTVPDDLDDDTLYKGGIRGLFKAASDA